WLNMGEWAQKSSLVNAALSPDQEHLMPLRWTRRILARVVS
ncbi:MAG: hypothetical protein ACI9JE_001841, partial [Candidatus Krumholzibacteriia bacterium]